MAQYLKNTLILMLLLVTALAQSNFQEKHSKEKKFLDFTKRHNKKYDSQDETIYRYSVFKDNQAKIEELKTQNPEANYDVNLFSDLTQEEFLEKYTGVKLPEQSSSESPSEAFKNLAKEEEGDRKLQSYPASLDLRSSYGVPAVRDQGSCGSCWAFSSIASLEYAYYKKYGSVQNFSEQQLVDCVYGYSGCNGGWWSDAFNYIYNKGGVALESAYPYKAAYGSCKESSVTKYAKITNFYKVPADDASVKYYLYTKGVLTVCVDATNWSSYTSGLFIDTRMYSQNPVCNHAVTIVGYGSSNNIPYYIIRNSWNTWWGESGYIKMDARRYANGNICSGLQLNYVYFPTL